MTIPVPAGLVVFVPMVIEAAVAARHDRALRALGAVEPAADVYRAMRIAYPAAFLAMLAEGAWRGAAPDTLATLGVGVFLAAKALKYWAIAALGPRWTFRVLVPPGSARTSRGPYRWIAHPNYVAVALELAGVALAMHARVAGPIGVAGFGYLMWRRVRIEDKALAGQ
ncbi:MAG TPA: isoprenylcysteine carboxylmethyltransferase family protein [Vicinamibacterales bacterium]